jgi:hypothetical protein
VVDFGYTICNIILICGNETKKLNDMSQNTFRKTLTDKRLEELSDKVRRGTPILMSEAIEVVEYQEMLKKNKVPFTDRIVNFFKIKK